MDQVSILQKSEIKEALRLDAEYYQPKYVKIENKLKKLNCKTLGELSSRIINFGAYSLCNYIVYKDKGVPFLNVENIKENQIDFNNVKYIDSKVHEILYKSKVNEGNVLLTMAGTIGNAAIAYKIPEETNSNQAIAKISLKPGVSAFYISTFLNSKYGKGQTFRYIISSVQPNIFLKQIKSIRVPLFNQKYIDIIEGITKSAYDKQLLSCSLYSQAKRILHEELRIEDFDLGHKFFYKVNLNITKQTNRIDAEFYQPKYEKMIAHIKKNYRVKELGTITNFLRHGKQPPYIENGTIPIITQKNMGQAHLDIDSLKNPDTPYTNELFIRKYPKYKLQKEDVLFYSVGAYLGRANVFLEDCINAVTASFVTIIRPKVEICNPIFLSILLNSPIGQLQSDKYSSASAQQYIYPKDIAKFLIPLIETDKQKKIANFLTQSYEALKQAKELSEKAKSKVEDFIEMETK